MSSQTVLRLFHRAMVIANAVVVAVVVVVVVAVGFGVVLTPLAGG